MKLVERGNEHGNTAAALTYFLAQEVTKDAKILDIGCHFGSLLANMHEAGYLNLHGVDVNEGAVGEGKKAYPILAERLKAYEGDHLPYPDNHFDVVAMFDVIEHIPDVERFLREEVLRVLRPGGRLIFQTPNIITNIPWEIINQRSLTKWRSYHCSLQSYSGLKKLLERAGFSGSVIERHDILTDHNREKVRRKMGALGVALLHLVAHMPLPLYTNFYGHCQKPD